MIFRGYKNKSRITMRLYAILAERMGFETIVFLSKVSLLIDLQIYVLLFVLHTFFICSRSILAYCSIADGKMC